MNDFQRLAVTTALKKLFEQDHFSICTVDKCLAITGCIPNKKDYQALNALHCVHYSDMPPELREMVMLKTLQMFENPGFDIEIIGKRIGHDARLLN